jgi:competence protein ComEC
MKLHFSLLTFLGSFFGAALFLFGPVSLSTGLLLFVMVFLFGLLFLWVPREKRRYLIFAGLGIILALSLDRTQDKKWSEGDLYRMQNQPVMVVNYPEEKSFYQRIVLRNIDCQEERCQKKILWEAPLVEEVSPGEKFFFSCELEEVKNFNDDFDYRMFLAKEGIGYLCKNGERTEDEDSVFAGLLLQKLGALRVYTEENLERSLSEPELGLAKGLILGGSDYLSESLETKFQRVGMTHIVAVSGYNILLVAALLLLLANLLGVWRTQALWAAFIGVVVFILFVGAPASAVRAGCMAGLAFLALLTGRKSTGLMILLVTATGMLLFNPLLLFHDIGFQLSFLAIIGILLAHREQEKESQWSSLWDAIRVTFWVELMVLPIILFHFGTLSWFSFFANIILIPLVPLAMFGSFALVVLGALLPNFLLPLFALPVYACLWAVISFVEFFGGLSSITLENIHIPWRILILWYAPVVTIGVLQLKRSQKKWYEKAFVVDSSK